MDLEKYRQVILGAIDNEIEARKFYEKVAVLIKDNHLKQLFSGFAKEEAKHELILKGILNKGDMDTTFFNFDKDFKVAETFDVPVVDAGMDLKNAIGIAMKNEEAAMKQYTSLAENCEDEKLKAVFWDLAAMERQHKFIMENDFVDVAYPEVW